MFKPTYGRVVAIVQPRSEETTSGIYTGVDAADDWGIVHSIGAYDGMVPFKVGDKILLPRTSGRAFEHDGIRYTVHYIEDVPLYEAM